ncbi:MAG: ComF family protein [Lewinellaceae bacterium]|nr:ComF family protein [Lewinellaceae bacterium]
MIDWRDWADDLLALFFPELCLACGEITPPRGTLLCTTCLADLPFTHDHQQAENPFAERFWGRLPIQGGAAFLHFTKKGKVQGMLHQLKYHGRQDLGHYLGRWYGRELQKTPPFDTIDCIVPIPLHPRKLRQRGFNQSACFAQGLADSWNLPCALDAVIRTQHTASQTRKSRLARFENVAEAFAIADPDILRGKHVLLVDDVLTTGATLEACGARILALGADTRLSLATIARARI